MPKTYSVKWVLDDSQAQGVFKRATAAVEALEKRLAGAGSAAERLSANAAKAAEAGAQKQAAAANQRVKVEQTAAQKIDVGYYKAVVNGIKYQDRLREAAEKKARDVEKIESAWAARDYRARVKSERDKERLDDFARSRNEKRIRSIEEIESAYIARDYQRRVAAERRKENAALGPNGRLAQVQRRMLSEEQVAAAARNRAADVLNKKAVDAKLAQMGLNDSFAEGIKQGVGFGGAATKAGLALAGLGAGVAVIKAVAGAFKDARAAAEQMARTSLKFMQDLRPLASVMGVKPDFAFAKKVAQFGVETGMGKAGAAQFLETFAGRANIVKGKNISEEEYEKFSVQAGKLATARGVPPELAGDLFASILKLENFQAKGQGARQALGRAGNLFDILDAGSGKMEQLGPQAIELMNALASENELEGKFRSAGEVGVVTSLMAENNPAEAATFGRATIKALSSFTDKDRQAFYQRAGIVPGQSAIESMQRANAVFEEEVGKGKPLEQVLSDLGLAGDVREKTGLLTMFKGRKTVLEPQLERMRAAGGEAGAAQVEQMIQSRFAEEGVQGSVARAEVEESELQREAIGATIMRDRGKAAATRGGARTRVSSRLDQAVAELLGGFGYLGRTGEEAINESAAIHVAQRMAGVQQKVTMAQAIYGDNTAYLNELKRIADSNEEMLRRSKQQQAGNVAAPPPQLNVVRAPEGPQRPGQ
jgi:hypothetical protein